MAELTVGSRVVAATLYPSRARVRREVSVDLPSGSSRLAIRGLPDSLSPDSLRVEAPDGLKVTGFSVERRTLGADEAGAEYLALEAKVRALESELSLSANRLRGLDEEYAVFSGRPAIASLRGDEKKRVVSVAYWDEYLAFMEDRLLANRKAARAELVGYAETLDYLKVTNAALERVRSTGARTELVAVVDLEAEAEGPRSIFLVSLEATARWRPAYAFRFSPDGREVDVEMYAMASQESGDDWADAEFSLSTATPLEDCSVPEPKSLRLRETETKVTVRSAAPAPEDQFLAAALDGEEFAKRDMECVVEPEPACEPMAKSKKIAERRDVSRATASMASGFGGGVPVPPPAAPRPQPQAQPRLEESAPPDFEAKLASKPSLGSLSPAFREYLALAAARSAPSSSVPTGPKAEDFSGGIDPGESCGGFDYRYAVAGRRSLPSRAAWTKLPVARMTMPARTDFVCVPCESDRVYARGRFVNALPPLPAGPAQVYRGDDFVASVTIPTIAPGREFDVSLGVDPDFALVRRERSESRPRGFGGKETITDFRVAIELVSFKRGKATVEIIDRVPMVSGGKDIVMKEAKFSKPPSLTSERGVALWRETLEEGVKCVIEFEYAATVREDARLSLVRDARPHDGQWMGAAR